MLKRITIALSLFIALSGSALAAGPCAPADDGAPKAQEYQRLLNCAQNSVIEADRALHDLAGVKLDGYADSVAGQRDSYKSALDSQSAQLAEANTTIAALRQKEAALQASYDTQSEMLAKAQGSFEKAKATIKTVLDQMATLQAERDGMLAKITGLTIELEQAKAELAARTAERDALRRTLDGKIAALKDRDAQIATVGGANAALKAENERLHGEIAALTGEVAAANAKIQALQVSMDDLNNQLASVNDQLAKIRGHLDAANAKLDGLKQENANLQAGLDEANAKLAATTAELDEANKKIADLLDALARPVKARDAFLEALRNALAGMPDVAVVDGRLVIQAEVLFAVGSAELSQEGRPTIERAAAAVVALQGTGGALANAKWVLQVNGHTDVQKIRGRKFKDNWELSTERALTVVRLMTELGVSPLHLTAAGRGEFQPIAPGASQQAYARNRRIDMELIFEDRQTGG